MRRISISSTFSATLIEDVVTHEILVTTSTVNVGANGMFGGELVWNVVKHTGDTRSLVSGSDGEHKFRLVGSGWTGTWQDADVSGNTLDIGSYLDGQKWKTFPSSTNNMATGIEIAYFVTYQDFTNNNPVATLTAPITIHGQMSRNLWFAGEWTTFDDSFEVTDYKAPYFSYTNGNSVTYWAFVGVNGTYKRTGTSATGTAVDNPSSGDDNWSQMNNEFKYLITEALFTSFGHFGGTVINGDYLFSQYGYMLGYGEEKVEISSGNQFQNVDPNDMFGTKGAYQSGGVNVQDDDGVTITSTSWATVGSAITMTSGSYYTWQVIGEGKFEVQLKRALPSSSTSICTIDSADAQTKCGMVTAMTGAYSIQVRKLSNSYSSTKYFCLAINKSKFVPWLCINMRSGESLMNKLFLRAGLSRATLDVTPDNYEQYTTPIQVKTLFVDPDNPKEVDDITPLNIVKLGVNARLTDAWDERGAPDVPDLYLPPYSSITESEKDLVRGLAGQDIIVINGTSSDMKIYGEVSPYYDNGSHAYELRPVGAAWQLESGGTAIIHVDLYLEETITTVALGGYHVEYGDENVRWRIRVSGTGERRPSV